MSPSEKQEEEQDSARIEATSTSEQTSTLTIPSQGANERRTSSVVANESTKTNLPESASASSLNLPVLAHLQSHMTPSSSKNDLPNEEETKEKGDNHSTSSSTVGKKSKTRFSKLLHGTVTINTCCGPMELSMVKILAIVGMVVNTISFLAIAALISYAQSGQVNEDIDILNTRTNVYLHYAYTNAYTLVAAYSGNNSYLSYYYAYRDTLKVELAELVSKLPTNLFNNSGINDNYLQVVDTQAVALINSGNYSSAISLLTSTEYLAKREEYRSLMEKILDYILAVQKSNNQASLNAVSATLAIIGISVIVIVPTIIFVFGFAINRDSMYSKRLKKAKAVALIDTMNNEKLRHLFENHCKKEYSLENFEFLVRVQEYKKLCEQEMELVQSLSDGESTSSGGTSTKPKSEIGNSVSMDDISSHHSEIATTNGKKKNSYQGKSIEELEHDLEEIEVKKYQLALEIYKVFLNVTGEKAVNITKHDADDVKTDLDLFEHKQIHALSEHLFEKLESAVSIVMLDSHHRFKESMEFMKAMKIDKVKKFKDRMKKKKQDK